MNSAPPAQQPWTPTLPWVALACLVFLAVVNLTGNPYGLPPGFFVIPVALAIVALVFAIRARRWVDIVVSALVIAAPLLWLLGLIFLFQFVHLSDNSFSP